MLLVAYLYGITSDRRLCEEIRYNLAYRWFCRLSLEDDIPDHSSLSRIRDRYGREPGQRQSLPSCVPEWAAVRTARAPRRHGR
jgi:IS5 family transposase